MLLCAIRGLSLAVLLLAGAALLALGIGTAGKLRESRTLPGGTRLWGVLRRVVLVASVVGGYCLALALVGAAASERRLW